MQTFKRLPVLTVLNSVQNNYSGPESANYQPSLAERFRYRSGARQPQMIDTGMSHIGFRCIVRTGHASSAEW